MRLKGFLVVVVAVLLPLAGFSGDQVPYKATLASTSLTIVLPGMGDTGRCAYLPTASLPPGTGWGLITITAVGNSTLMGIVHDVQSHCSVLPLDPTAPPPPVGTVVPAVLGEAVITAANGDQIRGSYEATLTFTEQGAIINGQLNTYDGTGRFKGARGTGIAYGVQTMDSAVLALTGTMSSVGSLKKN